MSKVPADIEALYRHAAIQDRDSATRRETAKLIRERGFETLASKLEEEEEGDADEESSDDSSVDGKGKP